MSFIIQQQDRFPNGWLTPQPPQNHPPPSPPPRPEPPSSIREALLRNLEGLCPFTTPGETTPGTAAVWLHLREIYRSVSALGRVRTGVGRRSVEVSLQLLTPGNRHLRVETAERRKLACKIFNSQLYFDPVFLYLKPALNPRTGELRLTTLLAHPLPLSYRQIRLFVQTVVANFALQLNYRFQPMQSLLELTNHPPPPPNAPELAPKRPIDHKIAALLRFADLSSVPLALEQENALQEQRFNQQLQREKQGFAQLRKDFKNFRRGNREVSLFCFLTDREVSFPLSERERNYLRDRASLSFKTPTRTVESNTIFNYIRLARRLGESDLRKVNAGGFSSISVVDIDYWFVGSLSMHTGQQLTPGPAMPTHKRVAVKRDDGRGGRSRVAHEKAILQQMRNGNASLLLKYYSVAEQGGVLDNALLMEYSDLPNLQDLLQQRKDTMVLHTKIYLLYLVACSLKFLHEYRVVHLDLKPANILMQKKFLIKVIDFGESYHPDLKHKHNPGFTQPYSAPEIYNCPAHYSSPSDIFSLGVIIYEMLLNRFPFYLERSKELCYRRGTVFQRWLAAPEDHEMQGDATLVPLLLLLADKCMHPNPSSRPQIEWIVIFLRECLEFPI